MEKGGGGGDSARPVHKHLWYIIYVGKSNKKGEKDIGIIILVQRAQLC